MKLKTSEATGPVLDWMVAVALGEKPSIASFGTLLGKSVRAPCNKFGRRFQPSEYWATGGPIIDRAEISLDYREGETQARVWDGKFDFIEMKAGKKQGLLAGMRCFVASKLGYEVEVPDELVPCQ